MGPQYGTVFLARRFLENLFSGSACNVRMTGECRVGKDSEEVGNVTTSVIGNHIRMLLRVSEKDGTVKKIKLN